MIEYTNTYTKNNLVLYTNPYFKDKKKQILHKAILSTPISNVDAFQDIEYSQLDNLPFSRTPDDTIFVCEMLGKSAYEYLEYIEVSQSVGSEMLVNIEVNFRMSKWRQQLNVLCFTECLRNYIKDEFLIGSRQDNLYDEDLVHIKFQISVAEEKELSETIHNFSKSLLIAHKNILSQSLDSRVSYRWHSGALV